MDPKEDGYNTLSPKIRSYFQKGLSNKQTFVRLCSDLNYTPIPPDRVDQIFQYIDGSTALSNINLEKKYCQLVFMITMEYGKFQNGIAFWTSDFQNQSIFKFLDSRYAVFLEWNKGTTALFLFDSFHGQKRRLHTDDSFPNSNTLKSLYVLDWEHLILTGETRNFTKLYLLRLNFIEASFTIAEYKDELEGINCTLIFDSKKHQSFCVSIRNYIHKDFWLGSVENNQIVINSSCVKMNSDDLMCARLVDNKLQTILPEIEEVVTDGRDDDFLNTNASFGEYALIPDQDSPLPRKLCNVQIKTLLGYFNFDDSKYCWFDGKCYMIANDQETNQMAVMVLDLEKEKMYMTKNKFKCCGNIVDWHFDRKERVLVVCSEYLLDSMGVYRFELDQPESLINQAFLKVRREFIFYGNSLYEKLLPCLPLNLQPMAILNLAKLSQKSSTSNEGLSLGLSALQISG